MLDEAFQRLSSAQTWANWHHQISITTLPNICAAIGLSFFLYLVVSEVLRNFTRLPNIDGPRGLPIIGNLHQLGPDPAERFRKWSLKYGGFYQIMMGNKPVVVFNSMQSVKDVFIGQGGALVDRPQLHTFHGVLSTTASSIGNTAWSESLKVRRKAAAKAMNRPATSSYIPLIDELSRDLMLNFLETGKYGQTAINPKPLLQHSILDLTMTVNYGARLPKDAALFDELTAVEDNVSRLRGPIGQWQDYVPILRWIPFNQKSRHAADTNRRRLVYLKRFNNELDERIKVGKDKPSIQANVLKDPEAKLNDIELLSISMSMISGGLDTMVHTLAWTVAALARRPDIQNSAYDAIRKQYGSESWGDPEDENGVPYMTALVKECLRYFSVLRLSLARTAWRDFEYEGRHIPKGTTVYLNVWGCNRDAAAFGDDAFEFRPERFLDSEAATGLEHATYGLGTRMCAGSHLANRQLYILLLRIIWSFKIELSTNPQENHWNARPLEDSIEPFHLAAMPPDYKVRFVPRNESALRGMAAGKQG